MTNLEIIAKCLPGTTSLIAGSGGTPETTREDILGALAGLDDAATGFVYYVYLDDPAARKDFFAGLYIAAFNSDAVRQWWMRRGQPSEVISELVNLAIDEWKHGKRGRLTQEQRAKRFGVSPYRWSKHFSDAYMQIVSIPTAWLDAVNSNLNHHLKKVL